MKIVTLTHVSRFDDDVPDDECVACAIEHLTQNRNFPNDDQVQITYQEGSAEDA